MLHFLTREVQRVFEIEAGEEVSKYCNGLSNLAALIEKDVPVLDAELRNGE